MFLDQRFRDSDKELWLQIAQDEGLVLTRGQRFIFMGIPSMDIVARRRREFSKEFPASPLINERRYHAFKEITNEFSKQSFLQKIFKRKGIV
jgi:hypothetical protein